MIYSIHCKQCPARGLCRLLFGVCMAPRCSAHGAYSVAHGAFVVVGMAPSEICSARCCRAHGAYTEAHGAIVVAHGAIVVAHGAIVVAT